MLRDARRRRIALPHNGRETALIDWGGDGPLALLHHANGFCAALWDRVAEQLRPHFRVVAMDARGHGESQDADESSDFGWPDLTSDLIAVAEALVAEDEGGRTRIELLIGHSFGGALSLSAVAQRPELFGCAALFDPILLPPMSEEEAARRRAETGMAAGARRRRQRWDSRAEARRFFAGKDLFANWQPWALDIYVAEGLHEAEDGSAKLKCRGAVEAAIFEGGSSLDAYAAAQTAERPVLVLRASVDSFPPDFYDGILERLADGSLVHFEGGHLAPMEAPERVAKAILDFALASHS